jgi:hypothetical protein
VVVHLKLQVVVHLKLGVVVHLKLQVVVKPKKDHDLCHGNSDPGL